jgi:hypothetical protein
MNQHVRHGNPGRDAWGREFDFCRARQEQEDLPGPGRGRVGPVTLARFHSRDRGSNCGPRSSDLPSRPMGDIAIRGGRIDAHFYNGRSRCSTSGDRVRGRLTTSSRSSSVVRWHTTGVCRGLGDHRELRHSGALAISGSSSFRLTVEPPENPAGASKLKPGANCRDEQECAN